MRVKVIKPITMNGQRYDRGDIIELGDHRARRLLAKRPPPVSLPEAPDGAKTPKRGS